MKTGTIDLTEGLNIPAVGYFTMMGETASFQLTSDDVTGGTFYLDFSLDGSNWAVAQDSGSDVSDTLATGAAKIVSFEADPGIYWRVRFADTAAGNVDFVINM